MKITEIVNKNAPSVSFEIFPPKRDTTLKSIDATLDILAELNPDYISVTFGAGGSVNNNLTVELAKKIKHNYGIEPVVHLTCLTHDKKDIDELIIQLKEADIENVLALRGDYNPDLEIKDDFKYASDLVSYIKSNGDFCVSGACYPECHLESKNRIEDILNLKKKVDAGVDCLMSQLFFDNDLYYSFVENCRIAGINVPIHAGIMPVVNKAQIERMVTLCGASLPDKFRKILNKYEDNKEALFDAGLVYAVNQIVELLASGVDGIHIYTMNNPVVAKRICNGIKSLI
ncbi:MAG: methylenetetrahydrofolate reductase [Lachnospira sp.]|nr:methylenetetrahydrofolate reductase [NAD(P)H] [Lachnospira sp.]